MTSLKKVHRTVESLSKVDRISHLQDDLLYHILSFLNVFDAVEAGLLSNRWKSLCLALPFLDIDIPKFCNERNLIDGNLGLSSELCVNFKDFINWVLTSRSAIHIIRLRLRCDSIFTQDHIFRWMCIAARRNVQELIVKFDPSDVFDLPFSLVNAQSLRILELRLFGRALQLPNYPGFLNLESLCLEHIKFTDQDLTRSFFSGCPSLKKLLLSFCTFENINVLHISSVTIEHLFFEDGYDNGGYDMIDLKISCPKLLAFKYGAPAPRQYIFEGVSSLETMHIHPSEVCRAVSPEAIAASVYGVLKMVHKIVELKLGLDIILGLCDMGDELRWSLCSFHGLMALNLWLTLCEYYMKFLSLLLERCPNLEALTLFLDEKCGDHILEEIEDLSEITCVRSTVNYVKLINFKGEEDEIELARSLLEWGLVLKKFVVYWSPDRVMDDEVVDMISSFPKSSASVEVVFGDPDSSISFQGWVSM